MKEKEMRAIKFLFDKTYSLSAAVSFIEKQSHYKSCELGLKFRIYDDFTVIVAEQMPEATQLTEPELMAWKEMRVAGGV